MPCNCDLCQPTWRYRAIYRHPPIVCPRCHAANPVHGWLIEYSRALYFETLFWFCTNDFCGDVLIEVMHEINPMPRFAATTSPPPRA